MSRTADEANDPALDANDVRRLLRFVGWTDADTANLPGLRRAIAARIDGIVEAFYAHLEAFPELDGLLGAAKARRRLRLTQRAYLLSFGQGIGEPEYTLARLRIGEAHERIGLTPRWYLGAYAKLAELIGEAVAEVFARTPEARAAHAATLAKVARIDSILAIESYHRIAMMRQARLVAELEDAQRRLEAIARLDALTGVRARRALVDDLTAEYERSVRFRRPFTVLFVDLDHFKAINDRHGHAAGDAVLRAVAATLAGAVRPADIVGRYGGEEFVVGLVECDGTEAVEVAERLRAAVAAAPIAAVDVAIPATVSVGLASLGPATVSFVALLDRADEAMYLAKRGGRNRVTALTPIKAPAPA